MKKPSDLMIHNDNTASVCRFCLCRLALSLGGDVLVVQPTCALYYECYVTAWCRPPPLPSPTLSPMLCSGLGSSVLVAASELPSLSDHR